MVAPRCSRSKLARRISSSASSHSPRMWCRREALASSIPPMLSAAAAGRSSRAASMRRVSRSTRPGRQSVKAASSWTASCTVLDGVSDRAASRSSSAAPASTRATWLAYCTRCDSAIRTDAGGPSRDPSASSKAAAASSGRSACSRRFTRMAASGHRSPPRAISASSTSMASLTRPVRYRLLATNAAVGERRTESGASASSAACPTTADSSGRDPRWRARACAASASARSGDPAGSTSAARCR